MQKNSSEVVIPVRVPFIGQIYLFKTICIWLDKVFLKTLKKQLHKKCMHEQTMNAIL